MKCICGFVRPTAGMIRVNGKVVGIDVDFPEKLGVIMEKPDVLVLDEPFNGLVRQGVLEMREILLGLCEKGKNIVIASHSEEDIGVLCNNVLHMENGKL